MHQLLGIIVSAATEDEATAAADVIMREYVTEPEGEVDWYRLVAEDEARFKDYLADNFGEQFNAIPVATDTGHAFVDDLWESSQEAWLDDFEEVKDAIENNDAEEILNEAEGVDLIRHKMWKLGAYKGHHVRLYREYGEGVRNQRDLGHVLEKADEYADTGEARWIVPVDAHY